MGILTLLRNAFGRSRKARATEAEGADRSPERTPDPTTPASTDEHELVAAAFDKVKIPAPTASEENSGTGPTAETEEASEPEAAPEPQAATVAERTPQPEIAAETEGASEPQVIPETREDAEPEVTAETREDAEPEAVADAESADEVKAEAGAPADAEVTAETREDAEPEAVADAESAVEEKAAAEEGARGAAPAEEAAEGSPAVVDGPESAEQEAEQEAGTEAQAEGEPTSAKAAGTTAEETAPGEDTAQDTQASAAAAAKAERTAPAAEAEPEPEPKAEQSTPVEEKTEPEPEPSADEDTPEPTTAEAGAEEEPESPETAPTETTAPQAADGESTPQGPVAGGAGGDTDAEGEAEAEAVAEAGKAHPAVPLAELKRAAPALTTAYKAATATLEKAGLTGTRAKLYLVLDRSASMRPYYKDGSAQALADQTLALAAHLDPEATVHVVFFSTEVDGTTDLTLTPGHETKIDDAHAGLGRMGRTSYHAAVDAVLAHYDENAAPGTPALVVFQTDGAPDAKTPATQSLTKAASGHPAVFFSFVAFGEHDNKAFDYLRKLKTGNTSFFHAGPTPRELTDPELYEGVLATWRP
ncbi:VWA domain-containing protein [Streptomyces sp. NPDC014991]|uniref:VWA domain-containing protein n=1 Tax=Streptomyces sp. NPDC014991 TaxID=3364935 RepID=UPI00370281AF